MENKDDVRRELIWCPACFISVEGNKTKEIEFSEETTKELLEKLFKK